MGFKPYKTYGGQVSISKKIAAVKTAYKQLLAHKPPGKDTAPKLVIKILIRFLN